MKASFFNMNRRAKIGTVTALSVIAAILLLIILNWGVSKIPSQDISADGMYTLSDTSVQTLSSVTDDVTLYYLCSDGQGSAILNNFLSQYENCSDHIHLEVIDTTADPTFTSVRGISDATDYSVLVSGDKRSRLVDYSDLFYYYCADLDTEFTLEEYSYYSEYLSSYGYSADEMFDGDSQITNAILYCTTDTLPHIYQLSGHGEESLSDSFASMLENNAMESAGLELLETGAIPEDCDVLFIFAPTVDLTDEETALIRDYLTNGGHLVAVTDYEYVMSQANLLSILNDYGMSTDNENYNVVMEGDSSQLLSTSYPYLFSARIGSHESVDSITSAGFLVSLAHPIYLDDTAHSVTPLFYTSGNAYVATIMADDENTTTYSDDQVCYVGAVSEDESTGSAVIWISGYTSFSDSINYYSSNGNYTYLLTLLNWMCGDNAVETLTIEASATNNYLSVPLTAVLWIGIVMAAAIPMAILITGIVILVRRKRN